MPSAWRVEELFIDAKQVACDAPKTFYVEDRLDQYSCRIYPREPVNQPEGWAHKVKVVKLPLGLTGNANIRHEQGYFAGKELYQLRPSIGRQMDCGILARDIPRPERVLACWDHEDTEAVVHEIKLGEDY